jgi:tetratricopeptide (TPR) repeat protein
MLLKNIKLLLLIIFMIFSSLLVFSSDKKDWIFEEQKAKKLFDEAQYDEAIILFREIILSSDNTDLKRESYFWVSKAYMNSEKYKQAETNLEYYLTNYKGDGLNYPEAVYQKGRLLFLQEQYQPAIDELNIYIEKYPDHELISNAYYWIGECLYALGQFDDAALFFNIVINKYPKSTKREASAFKLRLIEHKKSELALQNLLKWSQEQYISSLNQFKIKEKTLQQAISEYEKNKDKLAGNLNAEAAKKLQDENNELKNKIQIIENQMKEMQSTATDKDYIERLKQLQLKEELLKQKEETLKELDLRLRQKEKSLEK